METLEQLKAIIDGTIDGDLFYDGRYLNEKLHVRDEIDKYSIKGVKSHIVYDAPLYVNTGKLRSLSDIKLIIELMEGKKKAYQAYVALEEIKQKYNGENKIAKDLLKLSYECDEFAMPSDLRKDIKEFLGDL